MSAIDVDPEVLRLTALASAHAFREGRGHVDLEIKAAEVTDGNYEELLGSLVAKGPYAYTILPEVREDGSVKLPILTTREQIAEAYAMIRGWSDLLEVTGLTEIRGSWYLFQDNLSRGCMKGTTTATSHQTLGLFPSGSGPGITGELVWMRVDPARMGTPGAPSNVPTDPLLAREYFAKQYDRYLDGLRANDVDAVLEVLHDGVASALRDYVNDTGTLAEVEGKTAHRAHYEAFFAKYEVQSVQPLYVINEDWYVFAELRMTVAPKGGTGTLAYHTAEFFMPGNDGRYIARIGHGTQPV
jgi:hypothetical protein